MIIRRVLSAVLMLMPVAAPAAFAQSVRIERPSVTLIDVVGGSGASAWRLRYGTRVNARRPPSIVEVSPERAYFLHGGWLRLIDSTNGSVLGRWRFPNDIEHVEPADGGAINVRFQLSPWTTSPTTTVRFVPVPESVPPDWDVGSLASYRVAEWEAYQLLKSLSPAQDPWTGVIPGAAAAIPDVEQIVKRDPGAPFLRLALAKLMSDAGDPRAGDAFADVMKASSSDFTEWFRISAALDAMPRPQRALASAAYERAFRDFIRRGRDPRMMDMLITRLIVYSPLTPLVGASDSERNRYQELIYRIAPTGEGTDRAWALHADALERQGQPGADRWRARAAATARESLLPATLLVHQRQAQFMLLGLGTILAAIFWILTRQMRYTGQRRMRAVAAMRSGEPSGDWLGLRYWTARDRMTLLLFGVIGWLTLGAAWTQAQVVFKSAGLPVRAGMFNGLERFDEKYPATPERELLKAIGLQSNGDLEGAERSYRQLPQFAESWNNLGVILARAGRTADSVAAFTRALAIDPAQPEALLNVRGEATTQATQTFQQYAPDMKMTALPSRGRLMRAYLGPDWNRYTSMLRGPLGALPFPGGASYLAFTLMVPSKVGALSCVVVILLALVFIAFVRREQASIAPGRASRFTDYVLPGIAPAWRWMGGPILVTWCAVVLAAVLQVAIGTPYLLFWSSQSGLMRAFGYVTDYTDLNPPLSLLIAALVVLWAANGVVIRHSSRPVGGTT